ncbi:MAG: tyrosine-protein phosphatase, partial [Clostridiales bacterium]|nr:tyrosine-protein phosphatase [Clostridiales bacterium]
FGMFYRSAALIKMNRRERDTFQSLGVRTVLDFRSNMEVADDPDWIAPGCRYLHASGIQTMDDEFGGGNLDMRRQILRSSGKPELLDRLENYLIGSYQTMAEQPEAYRTLFRAILEDTGTPLLFHCTAGKDRTGVGAAFLLSALGVPYETVRRDYLLSNRFREKENKSIERKVRLFVRDKRLRRLINDMMRVQEAYLDRTFDTIERLYGGFPAFLHGALEVSPEELEWMRARFLYPCGSV